MKPDREVLRLPPVTQKPSPESSPQTLNSDDAIKMGVYGKFKTYSCLPEIIKDILDPSDL